MVSDEEKQAIDAADTPTRVLGSDGAVHWLERADLRTVLSLAERAEKAETAREVLRAAEEWADNRDPGLLHAVAAWIRAGRPGLTPPTESGTDRLVGSPEHVELWEAINDVVVASGGNAGNTSVARQKAVVRVERAIEALVRRPPTEHGTAREAKIWEAHGPIKTAELRRRRGWSVEEMARRLVAERDVGTVALWKARIVYRESRGHAYTDPFELESWAARELACACGHRLAPEGMAGHTDDCPAYREDVELRRARRRSRDRAQCCRGGSGGG